MSAPLLAAALDTASGSFGSLTWTYDTNGNRQFETRNAGTMPYAYSPTGSNWLYQRGSDSRYRTPNGNTASISGVASFTYDGFNRLATSVTASETTTYSYNALGERMKKRNQNGLQTVFHYGPNGELLYEKDQAGNTREYVWLDGRPLARIDNGTAIYYYHVDHLGTPQAMTNSTGTVVWQADYEPFGRATVKVATVANNLRLPGQYFDRETGLHYNTFRDYEPTTGRYIEADPIGLEGGMNVYEYALDNPLSYIDPEGLTGNSAQRRGAKRAAPPPPFNPSKEDSGSYDGLSDGVKGLLCAVSVVMPSLSGACVSKDLLTCSRMRCTPKCGEPYYEDIPSKEVYLSDPSTPCECIQQGINAKFDEPLPRL